MQNDSARTIHETKVGHVYFNMETRNRKNRPQARLCYDERNKRRLTGTDLELVFVRQRLQRRHSHSHSLVHCLNVPETEIHVTLDCLAYEDISRIPTRLQWLQVLLKWSPTTFLHITMSQTHGRLKQLNLGNTLSFSFQLLLLLFHFDLLFLNPAPAGEHIPLDGNVYPQPHSLQHLITWPFQVSFSVFRLSDIFWSHLFPFLLLLSGERRVVNSVFVFPSVVVCHLVLYLIVSVFYIL